MPWLPNRSVDKSVHEDPFRMNQIAVRQQHHRHWAPNDGESKTNESFPMIYAHRH